MTSPEPSEIAGIPDPVTQLAAYMNMIHEMYSEAIKVGFTEDQAFQITMEFLRVAGRRAY